MIYEYKCQCGYKNDYYFHSSDKVQAPLCEECGGEMVKQFSPPVLRFDTSKKKLPPGMIETGTEYPSVPDPVDHMDGVEQVMHDVVESGVDLDGSGDYELQGLAA